MLAVELCASSFDGSVVATGGDWGGFSEATVASWKFEGSDIVIGMIVLESVLVVVRGDVIKEC